MDFRVRKSIKVSELSDEQLLEFMESVQTDEEDDSSSDDGIKDPDFEPDEISAEDEHYISQVVHQINEHESTFINEAADFLLNISEITGAFPSASSTLHPELNVSNEEVVVTTEEVEKALGKVVLHDEVLHEEEPSTSTSRFKPPKRARSPLPEIECTGPSIVPSAPSIVIQKCQADIISKMPDQNSEKSWQCR